MKTTPHIVGEVCLYGTPGHGFGWLAMSEDGQRGGDGELQPHDDKGQAILRACAWLYGAGAGRGVKCPKVAIFDSGGERVALADLVCPAPEHALRWYPAPKIVIAAADILAAAAAQGGAA